VHHATFSRLEYLHKELEFPFVNAKSLVYILIIIEHFDRGTVHY